MIKSYLRKLRKRLLGGDLCDLAAAHDRDVRILAKQIGDLAEQVKHMAVQINRIGRELTHVAVHEAHLAARMDNNSYRSNNGYRPRP